MSPIPGASEEQVQGHWLLVCVVEYIVLEQAAVKLLEPVVLLELLRKHCLMPESLHLLEYAAPLPMKNLLLGYPCWLKPPATQVSQTIAVQNRYQLPKYTKSFKSSRQVVLPIQ